MNSQRWNAQRRLAPYVFVSPFVILFCVFFIFPLTRSLILSTYKTVGPKRSIFVGFANFRFLFHDRIFWLATANTVGFAIAFVTLQIPLSLGLAILLDRQDLRGRSVWRFAFLSTHLVGQVFVAVLFAQLLAPRGGLVNEVLSLVIRHRIETNWLADPRFAMLSVLGASLWLSVGFGMIYFLAALQLVDKELYDAAAVDGTTSFGRFWHITLPGIRSVAFFLLLVGLIGALQLFELPWLLFNQSSGPGGSALTIGMYLFEIGFEVRDLGYASAIGWMMVVLTIVVGIAPMRATKFFARE